MRKNKLSKTCLLWQIGIMLIFAFNNKGDASVRDEMSGIMTLDSLESYYYANKDNLYKRRYIIKYIPSFLEDVGATSVPNWIYDAINESLDSDYDALIEEAVVAAGKLEVADFTDKIVTVFKEAPQKYTAYSSIMRSAAINAIINIGGDYARSSIPELIQNVSRHSVTFPEFSRIMRAVQLFGDSTIIDSLENFKSYAEQQAEALRSKEGPWDSYKKYETVALTISSVMQDIIEREGDDE